MSMLSKFTRPLGGVGAGGAFAAISISITATPARAADPPASGPAVIAIANPEKIAEAIKEYQDLLGQIDQDQKTIQTTLTDKQNNVASLKQALTYLKPDSSQYGEAQDKLLKAAIEFDAWQKETQLDFDRKRKNKIKSLFQEIQDAIAAVAQKEGINLVIADQRPKIPDNLDAIDVNQLQAAISSRTVLYSDQSRDISAKVIDLMDKNYAAKQTPH